ncbi:MAG: M15 family metallopeptidase, partial [Bdellovibrionota bacterium]
MFWAVSILVSTLAASADSPLVNVESVVPGIRVDMRYFSDRNFLGRRVSGYEANVCLLTKEAAKALAEVQSFAQPFGLSLLVFDCYRPQRAVNAFVAWVKAPGDQDMREYFFPDEEKAKLIEHGYIDARSGHSRGSTLDLTLVRSDANPSRLREERADCRRPKNIAETGQLDMGTAFDCFSELAHTANATLSPEARKNRLLLKSLMEK